MFVTAKHLCLSFNKSNKNNKNNKNMHVVINKMAAFPVCIKRYEKVQFWRQCTFMLSEAGYFYQIYMQL